MKNITKNLFLRIDTNQLINIIIDLEVQVHAQRLLKQYLFQFNLTFVDIHEYSVNKGLINTTDFIIWVQDSNLPEGAFELLTTFHNQQPLLVISGGGNCGIIYAINELGLKHLIIQDDSVCLPSLEIKQTPTLPYRFMWTWDHSTHWHLEQSGMQEIGFANPYTKPQGGFLDDYCRLIDFMSLNRLNAVTIYGFLRDCHGGIEAAQELCRYANERGVRIMPGVGINCYGGVYWEGEHRYNLSHWLRENPHLRAQFKQPKHFELPDFAKLYLPETSYLDAACPSKHNNSDYHVEAIQWLVETFEIGGINFETGDYGTCQCHDCIIRREKDQQWSIKDMALLYPRLFTAAQQKSRHLWLVCEAYWDNLLNKEALAPLSELPDEAIYQFCTNRNYVKQLEQELTSEYVKGLPRSKNIWRTHMGSQWQQERYSLVADRYASLMQLAYKTGLQGGTIFGEVSNFNTVNELNYLAFSRFGYNATLTWEDFMKNDVAPLVGGIDEAEQYIALLKIHNSKNALKKAIAQARDISQTLSNDCYRRWVWLQNRLFQKLMMLT